MTDFTSDTSPLSIIPETRVRVTLRAHTAATPGVSAPLLGGLFFVALATGFIVFGLDYKLGTPRSMGPGMFPVMGGVLLAALGVALALTALRNSERVTGIAVVPLLATIGSVALFALLVERTGLAIAAPILVGGVVLATGNSWKQAIALAVPLTLAAIVIFPILLGVPLKVLP